MSSFSNTGKLAEAGDDAMDVYGKATDISSVGSRESSFSRLSNNSNLDVDTALAKELHRLSVQDRNRVQEEVHGVHFAVSEETPEMIKTSLQSFDEAVKKISGKHAYNFAMTCPRVDTAYIRSPEFKLRFLRATLFSVKRAALRYTRHLDLLYEFFGEVGLQRPLQLSDLSKVEKDCIKEGRRQILPSRDRSGRLIIFEKGSNPTDSRTTRVREIRHLRQFVDLDLLTVLSQFGTNG